MNRLTQGLPLWCALLLTATAHAQNFACLDCHDLTGGAAVNDFSLIYAHTRPHHPVDISYPLVSSSGDDFKAPNGQTAAVTFFDRNGNGQPDSNEVQMNIVKGVATIECGTCHIEHGTAPPAAPPATAAPKVPRDPHLRVTADASALCSTCHNQ